MKKNTTPPSERRHLGTHIEEEVTLYLKKQRLRLIAKNFSTKRGEIDLIFLDPHNTLIFTEVRYRQHNYFGSGADSVGVIKQKKIIHTALCYLQQNPRYSTLACRFDVVSVTLKQTENNAKHALDIEWIQHAFSAF